MTDSGDCICVLTVIYWSLYACVK